MSRLGKFCVKVVSALLLPRNAAEWRKFFVKQAEIYEAHP